MDGTMYDNPEVKFQIERCQKYQGTAKININQMVPHPSVSPHVNLKNVERLCEIFDKEGCRRLDIYNHVSAVVSRQQLDALQATGVNLSELQTNHPDHYPHLHFSTGSIKFLHGQHRLKAAEHYLPSIDQWWIVDLYLDGLQTSLVDEYSNERVPSDGEIYVKVRQYRNEANVHFENRWLARLSDNKARRLRGLESHPSVRAAFDSLLVLPSLLIHGMQIGSLPQALAISCDEEIVHALNRLLKYWSSLVGHDRAKMLRIETHTVEKLQLLAPGVSSKDRTTVKGLVHSGEVFSNFTGSERSSIWKRLKRTDGIIPSLYTFFKDLWYLESCANCIKRLITPSRSCPTVRSAMRAAFSSSDPAHTRLLIQTSETGLRYYSDSQGDPAELGYRQLWLYAMRHYPKLSKQPQKLDPTAKATNEVVDPVILYDMAVLAKKLGFQSPQIQQLIQQSPDRKIAQDALLRARRPDRYRYTEGEVELLINKVTECFLRAIPLDHQLPVQSIGGIETKKESRCGHPQTQAQLHDCQFLFIDKIHGDSIKEDRKATSILVRRSVYFTFFSKLSIPIVDSDTTGARSTTELPMSPLFVPSNRSSRAEIVDREAERESNLDQQRLNDARQERRPQKRAKKLQRRQHREQKRAKKLQRQQRREQQMHQSSHSDHHSISPSRNLQRLPSESGMEIELTLLEGSGLEEVLDPTVESESRSPGSDSIIGGDEQGFPDIEPSLPDELEHLEPIPEEQLFSGNEESEWYAELGHEDEQRSRESEERLTREESLGDTSMEEHAVEQEDEATETAQVSPSEEVQRALHRLEGRRQSRNESGPSRTIEGKGAALREMERFKPYDQTERRRQTPKLSMPPQETLEQDINALLQTAAQQQTPRPITQINFLEAQNLPPSGMNEEQNSSPAASQEGPTYDHQQAGEKLQDQSQIGSTIDGNSRRYGMTNIQSERQPRRLQSVTPNASPDVQVIADATQQGTLTERASLSPALEPSTHGGAHAKIDIAKSEKGPEERDRSPRREGASGATKSSKVTIMFRARDKRGEWNRLVHKMAVDPSDPSPVERMAAKQARKQKATYYDQNLRQVPPGQCFQAAIEDGTNTVFMTFGDDLTVSEATMDSITRALQAEHDDGDDDDDDDQPAKLRKPN
ncbi:uncharacterized protein N7496_006031 [Penicillium cataractarum]|uniref:Uncharacterized protein n=1 Tax=Penicillium cataractarum TaxID=2100454 RepID=A0A9W9V700_9EURO|nr:uncharacterized protein N7496_006031 [Penicillium cataractarum]KAJ5369939.1 hypothetical protein N7496_006031 [Penicillium cataractarum]